jgi:hypothetical protein
MGILDYLLVFDHKPINLRVKPGQNALLKLIVERAGHEVHVAQGLNGAFPDALEVLFGDDPSDMLRVGSNALSFPCSLLNTAPRDFLGNAHFSSLHPLGLNELSVADLLIFLRLFLDDGELMLFKDFHLRLLKGLFAEHVEHRLNFLVKIKKFVVSVVDLRRFTVLLRGHLRGEERHWRTVEVELSCNADFVGLRFVC